MVVVSIIFIRLMYTNVKINSVLIEVYRLLNDLSLQLLNLSNKQKEQKRRIRLS
jgi:hypothetical protein